MTEPISLTQLTQLATTAHASHEQLVAAVRRADANGIPKVKIAEATGLSRETVRRWCSSVPEN